MCSLEKCFLFTMLSVLFLIEGRYALSSPWEYYLKGVANLQDDLSSENIVKSTPSAVDLDIAAALPPENMWPTAQDPCEWRLGATVCKMRYEPICVTDLHCIFIVNNQCELDKMNCGCSSYHRLQPNFCNDFIDSEFRRCNIKIFLD